MKTHSRVLRAAGVLAASLGVLCLGFSADAEGLNAAYARMANGMVPGVCRVAGRDFIERVLIQQVEPAEMAGILAEDLRLLKAEKTRVAKADDLANALSRVVPVRYSLSRRRLYFSVKTLNDLFQRERIAPANRDAATRLLLAYELTKVLCDQQFDMRRLLAGAGSEARSRSLRALLEGECRLTVSLLARDAGRLSLASPVSAWAAGRGASSEAGAAVAGMLDEDFDIGHVGGYRMASYLYDQLGIEAVHQAYFDPPSDVSLLYNPAIYAAGRKLASPPPEPPGSKIAAVTDGAPSTGNTGESRLRTALLEVKHKLPDAEWLEKAIPFDALTEQAESSTPGGAQALRDAFAEWEGMMLVSLNPAAAVTVLGFQLHGEVTEAHVQQLMRSMEESLVAYGTGDSVYTPEEIVPMAGIGFGSGWLQPGTLADAEGESVPTWLLVARTGSHALCIFAANLPMTQPEVAEMVTAAFAKLQ